MNVDDASVERDGARRSTLVGVIQDAIDDPEDYGIPLAEAIARALQVEGLLRDGVDDGDTLAAEVERLRALLHCKDCGGDVLHDHWRVCGLGPTAFGPTARS